MSLNSDIISHKILSATALAVYGPGGRHDKSMASSMLISCDDSNMLIAFYKSYDAEFDMMDVACTELTAEEARNLANTLPHDKELIYKGANLCINGLIISRIYKNQKYDGKTLNGIKQVIILHDEGSFEFNFDIDSSFDQAMIFNQFPDRLEGN